MNLPELAERLKTFPWKTTGLTLVERFREDRLGLTASSLTFTTTMALVPFFTVALAVFSAFPAFSKLESALQAWFVQSLIPESIARQVLGYLTQFAGKASRLGAVGFGALFVTALALVLTIDRTLNGIWRVRRPRSLAQRVLIYWAVMTLGPLLLGASLSLTSYVVSASRGIVSAIPGGVQFLLDLIEFALMAGGLAALYRFVPNTAVKREHAWAGAIFAAVAIEVARRGLAFYLGNVHTYSLVYGAFATLPILLVWIYVAWLILLFGAVIAAYLPSLLEGSPRRGRTAGWAFQLALETVKALADARSTAFKGLTGPALARALQVDALQLEPVLTVLGELDWIGRVNETHDDEEARYVLLVDPQSTLLAPLVDRLLVHRTPSTEKVWAKARLNEIRLSEAV